MAIRVVLAGVGARGREWARALRSHPGFELAGIVDPNETLLAKAGLDFEVAAGGCHQDLGEAVERVRPSALLIATPENAHISPVSLALERKIPLLVEKPLTLRLGDSVDLVRRAQQAGVPMVVGQNYRYMRAHRTVRKMVHEGRLGKVGMIVAQYFRPPHPMTPVLESLRDRILYGPTIHHIDAMRWVLGQEVTAVSAETFRMPWGDPPPGSSVRAHLTFDGGARANYVATYESTGHQFFEGGQEFYERVVGERGTLHVFHRWLFLCEGKKLPRPIARGGRPVTEESLLLDQLGGAMLDGETPSCSGEDHLKTMAVLEAIIVSSEQSRTIDPRELVREQ
ncbi:MAG TPA: Gfo/Idh/MocA family oxidoreductase [Thermoanaerobaculia bacterium]|nr:Gfo/Idh/MocA family oxidoreductase [Thermoanaerobaculia bacterium]